MDEYLTEQEITEELRRLSDYTDIKNKAAKDIEEIRKRIAEIENALRQLKGTS